jgi:L-arabinose isomerase
MLFEGMDKKAITDSLFISEETVKKHIYNIFRKDQVKNRQAFGTYFEYFGRLKKPINQLIYRLLMHFDNRLSGEGGIRTNYIISLIINILTNRKQSYYTNYTFDFLAVVNPLYKEKESSGKAQIINSL